MNKISLIVVLPVTALLAGVIFATFYHKYDTGRGLFEDRNLTIEDLSGIAGNIVSLQKDRQRKHSIYCVWKMAAYNTAR